jgi:hypothetical protein
MGLLRRLWSGAAGRPATTTSPRLSTGVDAVIVGTRPESANHTVRDCAELGIKHVWKHRAFGPSSVAAEATEYIELHRWRARSPVPSPSGYDRETGHAVAPH